MLVPALRRFYLFFAACFDYGFSMIKFLMREFEEAKKRFTSNGRTLAFNFEISLNVETFFPDSFYDSLLSRSMV